MNAIITDSLTKTFTSRIGVTQAVTDLSLLIKAQTIYGLIGHNGAGKTTTFMLLNSLLKPSDGSGWIFGLNLDKDQMRIRRLTGLLTEGLRLYDELTVEETLLFFADLYRVTPDIDGLLKRFELEEWRKQQVERLSTGMRKKVAILSACIHHPKLLFLDEPFSGLDPLAMQGLREFIEYLLEYTGMTIIIASHNLRELADLCHEVGIMKEGRLVANGSVETIKANYGFQDSLLLNVSRIPEGLEELVRVPGEGQIEFCNNSENLARVMLALEDQQIRVLDMEKKKVALETIYQKVYEEVVP